MLRISTVTVLLSFMLGACTPVPVPVPPVEEPAGQPESVSAAVFAVQPSQASLSVGESMTFDLVLDSGTEPINAVDIVLTYDPALLSVVDDDPQKEGVQVTTTNAFEVYPLNVAESGMVKVGAAAAQNDFVGKMTVAQVTFIGQAPGTSSIDLTYEPGSHTDTDVFSSNSAMDVLMRTESSTVTVQ